MLQDVGGNPVVNWPADSQEGCQDNRMREKKSLLQQVLLRQSAQETAIYCPDPDTIQKPRDSIWSLHPILYKNLNQGVSVTKNCETMAESF